MERGSADVRWSESGWHAPRTPVLPTLGVELRPAQQAADHRSTESDVVNESELSALVWEVKKSRCLHRSSPYENEVSARSSYVLAHPAYIHAVALNSTVASVKVLLLYRKGKLTSDVEVHTQTGRPERMALCLQPAARVDNIFAAILSFVSDGP